MRKKKNKERKESGPEFLSPVHHSGPSPAGVVIDQANLGQCVLPHPQATYPGYMDTHPTYSGQTAFQLHRLLTLATLPGFGEGGFILLKDDGGRGRRLGWIARDSLMVA